MKVWHIMIFPRQCFVTICVVLVLIMNGCATVGPDYVRPATKLPDAWRSGFNHSLVKGTSDPQTLCAWWSSFQDQELSRLIERAVAGNLDLKKASARVREARAQRGKRKGAFFPTIDASSEISRKQASETIGNGENSDLYTAGFDAVWELDVFGGKRRTLEAAGASLESSQENRRDVLVSLLAEVALNYLDVRTYQTRLRVTQANLKAQDETLQLTTWRHQAGLTDELAVQQARGNRETTRSQLPSLRLGLEQAANRLAVLLGEQPGSLRAELMQSQPIPVVPVSIAVGVPADILRQRPDVRRAERDLAAQTARVGVATAELYPKFTLNGSIGLEALTTGAFHTSDAQTSSRSGIISWRIFDAGSIRENIKAQTALQEQYLCAYESAVLGALEEVENALSAFAEEQNHKQSLSVATQAARRSVELALNKYQGGLSDFSTVLDAQRSVLALEDQLAQSEGEICANLVRLYKALGGGWSPVIPKKS